MPTLELENINVNMICKSIGQLHYKKEMYMLKKKKNPNKIFKNPLKNHVILISKSVESL